MTRQSAPQQAPPPGRCLDRKRVGYYVRPARGRLLPASCTTVVLALRSMWAGQILIHVIPRRAVLPFRIGLGLAAIAIVLLAIAWSGGTGPWPDGVTTTGRVAYVQDRWSPKGGSARVTYQVDGTVFERWLPDSADQGRVTVGDPYVLEYRAGDPTEARGVAANHDDIEFQQLAAWLGVAAAILAVAAAVVTHRLWRQQPTGPPDAPGPRRSR